MSIDPLNCLRAVAAVVLAHAVALAPALAEGDSAAKVSLSGPAEVGCETVPVYVRAPHQWQVAPACEGARDAMLFLADVGVLPGTAVRIELVAQLPAGTHYAAVGAYFRAVGRVSVLNYERFLQRKSWLGVAIDRTLHRALIAHETAHAIVACAAGARELSVVAQEYVAYVTTFATMPGSLRAQVLVGMPGAAFEHEDEINLLAYAFDPMRFGAAAWRHFERQADRAQFMRRVLDGKVLRDPYGEALRGEHRGAR